MPAPPPPIVFSIPGGVGADSLTALPGGSTIGGLEAADTLVGLGGNDALVGGLGDDVLSGGLGADSLWGGTGNDTLDGGDGSDMLSADAGADSVFGAGGDDTIWGFAGVSTATLSGGNGADVISGGGLLQGGAENDSLAGDIGADTLDGGTGADTMAGGNGNDIYIVDNAGDLVIEAAGAGTDRVVASVSFSLAGQQIENLTLTGAAAINATGNALANRLVGNGAANVLNGAAGADTMEGGNGDDTYVVDDAGDRVFESAGAGTDRVFAAVSFSLAGQQIENLTLTGAAAINGTGNALANRLVGNAAANILNGGAGADTMEGGNGDDTYSVDDIGDRVFEAVGGGTDRVIASVSFSLAGQQIENLTLTGAAAINGTGNALANRIVGNAAANVLNGGLGADTLQGGNGNDTYVVDDAGDRVIEAVGGGTDRVFAAVSFSLAGQQIENLTLTGAAAINGTGNLLANRIVGNGAANVLNGGAAADTMEGGNGNDTYLVDNSDDRVIELLGGGTDQVFASASFSLAGQQIENLTLTGTAAINATGNSLANRLIGNGAANILDGDTGADTMEGGAGRDQYFVRDAGDLVVEAVGGGTDLVYAFVSHTLAANVEELFLLGTAAINGTGNALNNNMSGNSGANFLQGLAGDDSLSSGLGADTLSGGSGNDVYYVSDTAVRVIETAGNGADTVLAQVSHTLAADVEDLVLVGNGTINGTGNALNNLIFGDGWANSLQGLGGDDSLTGGDGADTLDGGAGADTMAGGIGGDAYFVDNAGDSVIEAAGNGADTIRASISLTLLPDIEDLVLTGAASLDGTGNGLANRIAGNAAANVLNGASGADTLIGGNGADTLNGQSGSDSLSGGNGDDVLLVGVSYADTQPDGTLHFDTAAGGAGNDLYVFYLDTFPAPIPAGWLIEAAGGGADTLSATTANLIQLPDHVEFLDYFGMGDNGGNAAVGNALDNVIRGFGTGVEISLAGGAGNDTITALSGWGFLGGDDGNDSINADETNRNLITGGNGNDTVSALGDQSDDTIDGGSGNDSLVGGPDTVVGGLVFGEADTMSGGSGNDTLLSGAAADTLDGGEGDDSLIGGASFTFFGPEAAADRDLLTGGNGNDTLFGGWGNDTILGGAGADSIEGLTGLNLLDGGDGADTIFGTQGVDTLIADGAGAPSADYMDALFTGTFVSRGGGDTIIGGISEGAIDQLALDLSWRATAISFTHADPLLTTQVLGDAGTNVMRIERFDITGGGGGDALLLDTGGIIGAADTLRGGEGADTLGGGAGNDRIGGDNGNDSLLGGNGDDALDGGNGDDSLDGGSGADELSGGAGADSLSGGDGADTLQGGTGADRLLGGANNDRLVDSDTASAETIAGDAGNDTVVASGGGDSLSGGANFDLLELDLSWRDVALGFAAPAGTDSATITGDGTRVTQFEQYYLRAGSGNDSLSIGAGGTLDGGAGNDSLAGALGFDVLRGGEGADTLDGGTGGGDLLVGGNGDDVYIVQADWLSNTLFELLGGGTDEIRSLASSFTMSDAANIERLVVVNANASGTGWGGNDIILGADGAQTLDGGGGDNTLSGLAGDDLLIGGFGRSSLSGGDGADTLDGRFGADTMAGGNGDDVYLLDFEANDLVVETSGAGTDEIRTSVSSFTLLSGSNIERLVMLSGDARGTGSSGNETLLGASGAQTLEGADGADSIAGLDGGDSLDGGGGADTIAGGEDADRLAGGDGGDQLDGGGGADTIEGAAGADTLIGGDGADVFRYAAPTLGPDLVDDFTAGTDRIEVSFSGFGFFFSHTLVVQSGSTPTTAGAQFILDTDTRELWFDPDGLGFASAERLLVFKTLPALTSSDIVVYF